jgi:hypothetical protein
MAEEQDQPEYAKEQIDAYIAEQVKANMAAIQQAEAANKPQPQQQSNVEYEKQVRDVLDPIYGVHVDAANFNAADAKDYVDFYSDDIHREYKEEVEAAFKLAREQGRPTSRNTLYRYILGDNYTADPAKFDARQKQIKQKQLDRASSAGDVGGGGIGREREAMASLADVSKVDPNTGKYTMPLEDMEKALAGMTF